MAAEETKQGDVYQLQQKSKYWEIRIYRYIGYSNNAMSLPQRQYSNREYNRAAHTLLDKNVPDSDKDEVYKKISEWRSLHQFPLDIVYNTLRERIYKVDKKGLISQRNKRLPSIIRKLGRINTELTQIQDIGGCRGVVENIKQLNELTEVYKNDANYKLRNNYVNSPKEDGYRSIHFIYTHQEKDSSPYNGIKIELQLRTQHQHAWATAVETVDVFTNQALKFGGGQKDWKRFFSLMSSYLGLMEFLPVVPNTPDSFDDLSKEIWEYEAKLDAVKILEGYTSSLKVHIDYPEAGYLILEQYPAKAVTDLIVYNKSNYAEAVERYNRDERLMAHENINIVLVSVESLRELLAAYPNYFGDTSHFLYYVWLTDHFKNIKK